MGQKGVNLLFRGTGIVEKHELTKTQQIYNYNIKGEGFNLDLELPGTLSTLRIGQKVKLTIHTSEPKTERLLTLRGQIYEVKREKEAHIIAISFGGLQGIIRVARIDHSLKLGKTIYLSVMEA